MTAMRILITGSSRGIGLDMTRRYLERGDTVFATCRNPEMAAALQALARQYPDQTHIIALDVTDTISIDESLARVRERTGGLDLLVNNAGTFAGYVGNVDPRVHHFGALEVESILDMLRLNTIAPVMVAQAYADLLRQGQNARLVNMSSDAGSITQRSGGGGNISYAASKTALNMFTRCLAGSFRDAGVKVIALHPGWILTDMGGPNARMTLDEAIPGVIDVIDNLTPADSGAFFQWDGSHIPW